jgi:D-3-phosphoglycerate dehydrogenase / 2-oxoglutarate reductase
MARAQALDNVIGLRRVLIAQPIHSIAQQLLETAGFEVRTASSPDAAVVTAEIPWADVLIVRNLRVDSAMIEAARELRLIGVHGVGTDRIDLGAVSGRAIAVFNTPDANATSVAEHAMALLLGVAKRIIPARHALQSGDDAFRYRAQPIELAGKTAGIVGYGRVGRAFAVLARAFGMQIVVFDPALPDESGLEPGERVDDLDTLLRESDAVSLHVPLTPATKGLIDARRLWLMKPSAVLVNTARGALVDEEALLRALLDGQIAGAGLDVFAVEPVPAEHPLLHLDPVVATPHLAGSTDGALRRTALALVDGIERAARGERPPNLIDDDGWLRARRRIIGDVR